MTAEAFQWSVFLVDPLSLGRIGAGGEAPGPRGLERGGQLRAAGRDGAAPDDAPKGTAGVPQRSAVACWGGGPRSRLDRHGAPDQGRFEAAARGQARLRRRAGAPRSRARGTAGAARPVALPTRGAEVALRGAGGVPALQRGARSWEARPLYQWKVRPRMAPSMRVAVARRGADEWIEPGVAPGRDERGPVRGREVDQDLFRVLEVDVAEADEDDPVCADAVADVRLDEPRGLLDQGSVLQQDFIVPVEELAADDYAPGAVACRKVDQVERLGVEEAIGVVAFDVGDASAYCAAPDILGGSGEVGGHDRGCDPKLPPVRRCGVVGGEAGRDAAQGCDDECEGE